ncbi:unnamed protein product [Clavelina lepadiformis]|uniref:C-type lectin domain-containing protein n=1 Tax=Clavelina lepadiformis TaxID=159417 RepID=A0ABP0GET6_CLALP
MISIYLVILCFVLTPRLIEASGQHLICKTVGEVFDASSGQQENLVDTNCDCTTAAQPGKRGPRGEQGLRGPPGPPSIPSYEEINNKLRQELEIFKKKLTCFDGVVIDDKCYRLLYRVGARINYVDASNLCAFHGGSLAEVDSEEAYNSIYAYVRNTWSLDVDNKVRNFVQVWMGSTYQGNAVVLRSGQLGFTSWYPRYPRSTSGHNRMAIEVALKPAHTSSYVGMFNINAGHVAIPFCQFSITE